MADTSGDKIKVIQQQMKVLGLTEIAGYSIDNLPANESKLKEIVTALIDKANSRKAELEEYAKNKIYWQGIKINNPFIKTASEEPPKPKLYLGKR